jgi:hypothetical protein
VMLVSMPLPCVHVCCGILGVGSVHPFLHLEVVVGDPRVGVHENPKRDDYSGLSTFAI